MTTLRDTVPSVETQRATRNAQRATRNGLTLRIISGFVAVPLLLGVAYLGDPVYGAFICLATGYAAFEIRGMLRAGGYAPLDWALIGLAVVLPLDRWLAGYGWPAPDGLAH